MRSAPTGDAQRIPRRPTSLPTWRRSARSLRAGEPVARAPIESYATGVTQFDELFLARNGMPRSVADIRRQHIQSFVEDQLARLTPGLRGQSIPLPPAVLPLARLRGRDPGEPDGPDASAGRSPRRRLTF